MEVGETRIGAARTRPPFVGREDERELIRRAFDRTVREPATQLITVVGEPGVGKTRLLGEFREDLEGRGDAFTWRQGRCLPYGQGVVFWALGEIVKAQAGILESDPPEEAGAKLAAEVALLPIEASEREWVLSRLRPLVGAAGDSSPGSERTEAFTAWRRFLEAVAARSPLVLVFEDMHWADDAMLEFVDHLLEWSMGVPLLVLCAARPELFERRPGWGGGKRLSTTLALTPLTEEETARLLSALLSQAVLPAETQAVLIERSGGNPLYAEQFVSMLTDQGILSRHGNVWLIDQRAEIPVPGSARALIAARLGTLPRSQRDLLRDAAVFGRVFWEGGVVAISGANRHAVRYALADLIRREMVRPVRTSAVKDEPEYSFWHLLLRDVAFSDIPETELGAKHRAAAEWIVQAGGDRMVDHAEILAHHYRQALAHAGQDMVPRDRRELEELTLRFVLLAGDRALDLDVEKADDYYREALALRPPDDPAQIQVLRKMAVTAQLGGHFPQAAALYQRAVEELGARGRDAEAASAMLELAYVRWNQGETAESREVLAEALHRLEQQPAGPSLVRAYAQRAADLFMAGQTRPSLEWCDRTIELAERLGLDDLTVRPREIRGMNRCDLGDWGGLDDLREALRLAKERGRGEDAVRSYLNLGTFVTPMEGPVAALELYSEGMTLAARRGLAYVGMWIRAWSLGVLFELGLWDELLATADEVLEWDQARGGSQLHVAAMDCKAEVLACRGQFGHAVGLIDEYLPRARAIGDPQILVPALAVATLTMELAGEPRRAIPWVEELEELSREGSAWVRTLFLQICVRAMAAAGRSDLGEKMMETADLQTPRGRASVLTGRAVLAEVAGNLEEAADLYRDAAKAWDEYGFPLERARAQLGQGRSLPKGDARGAHALAEARSTLANLGAEPLVREIDQLLAEPGTAAG